MKKRWIAIALLTVLLMGIGGAIGKVGVRQESGGSAYSLYFVERDLRSADGGDALRSEERTLEDGGLSTEELAAALVAELLKGPADPTLKSPFPKGTALLSAEQKGTELRVDLSAAYSTLSGVGLSLADYAITLTLTQLPDVARVRITVAGRELDYRSRQVFLARDILTVPKEDVVGTVDASLYFVNGDGALTAEARTLNLYEGDTQVSAVVRALENGPETKGLSAVLPEGFKVRKVWLEEEICYVSLSSALLEGQPEPAALETAVRLGVDTILTSGQQARCTEGAPLLRELVEKAGERVQILVGAGVNADVIRDLQPKTGANAFHLSAKRVENSRMQFRRENVPMGLPGLSEFSLWRCDENAVRAAREAFDACCGAG